MGGWTLGMSASSRKLMGKSGAPVSMLLALLPECFVLAAQMWSRAIMMSGRRGAALLVWGLIHGSGTRVPEQRAADQHVEDAAGVVFRSSVEPPVQLRVGVPALVRIAVLIRLAHVLGEVCPDMERE